MPDFSDPFAILEMCNLALLIAVLLTSPRWKAPLPLTAAGIAVFDSVVRRSVPATDAQTVSHTLLIAELCALTALFGMTLRQRRKAARSASATSLRDRTPTATP